MFGPYQHRVEALLRQNEQLPPKQRYTAHRIFEVIREEGYQGSESTVRHAIASLKQAKDLPEVFLPLEFDPGQDAQVDWGEAWADIAGRRQQERSLLLPLPRSDYECCEMKVVRLTPYSQATYETNRYSVPVNRARREVTLKAYPFLVEIWEGMQLLASHPRCYEREQDIFDPLHYLPLLEQRPGAFDYAKPMKQWRKGWPQAYHQMLAHLRQKWPDGRGVQEFVRILQLHQTYTHEQMEQAIQQALTLGCVHLDGVLYCLRQITGSSSGEPATPIQNLDLSHRPDLDAIGKQPIDLSRYDRLLKQSW